MEMSNDATPPTQPNEEDEVFEFKPLAGAAADYVAESAALADHPDVVALREKQTKEGTYATAPEAIAQMRALCDRLRESSGK